MPEENTEPRKQASDEVPPKSSSSEHAGEWEKAGRVIGRFAGKAGSFLGKAGEVVKDQYEEAQQREGDSLPRKIWDQARECVKKGANEDNVARLKELASLARENTTELSEGAADRIARIYTDATGNSATAAEVKQVALRFGVMAVVTFVTASVLGRGQVAQHLFSQFVDATSGVSGDGGKPGCDSSFEERTAQFYSNEGAGEGTTEVIDVDVAVDLA